MMKEIGSEFWEQLELKITCQERTEPDNTVNLLSGRTALDFIIRDIKASQTFQNVVIPSYCCESMIEPFVRNDVTVHFYKINYDTLVFPVQKDFDAILILDYFGYEDKNVEEIAKWTKTAGKIVIYDATHKINGHSTLMKYVDYSFCSYRKWFYCNYANVTKSNGAFRIKKPSAYHEKYCALRNQAADLKTIYMKNDNTDKTRFLRLYYEAENVLEGDYIGYIGKPIKINLDEIIKIRRENARFLIRELESVPEIRLWKNTIGDDDVPLFVPIFMKPEVKSELRKRLIENDIYCPVHWPISNLHKIDDKESDIYLEELSLVCDQRYGVDDMKREVKIIKAFIGEQKK